MKTVTIILPAFNEAKTIQNTIRSFINAHPRARIVVIDNASTDDTAKIANATFKKLQFSGSVLYEARKGKGYAIRKSFSLIESDIYIISDADSTYPAHQIKELIKPLLDDEADMVVGDRHSLGNYSKENKRQFHSFGNKLVNFSVNLFFGSKLNDIMSGYRALNRDIVKNYPVLVDGFQIETDLTLFALDKRFRIKEVPIAYQDRPEGSFSKLNTIKDGARVLFIIFQTLRFYKPLIFFSIMSLIALLFAAITGYPVIDEYIRVKMVTHIPLAILSASIMILAILFFVVGMILDSIAHQNRINFELRIIDKKRIIIK